jgi:hypothetical protein
MESFGGLVQPVRAKLSPQLRIDEAPLVTNVHIVPADVDTPPSGVGEPGVPPFASALVNAIFAATGQTRPGAADRQVTKDEGAFHRAMGLG